MTTQNSFRFSLLLGLFVAGVVGASSLAFYAGMWRGKNSPLELPPVWASASCESEGCVIATGTFAGATEALYYLDSQSGRLSAAILSRSVPAFNKMYTRNIKADLVESLNQLKLPIPAVPRFVMVTGENDVRQVGSDMSKITKAFVYIAEANTGVVLVYALPNEGDRDLDIQNGEIYFWTYARLNNGGNSTLSARPPVYK